MCISIHFPNFPTCPLSGACSPSRHYHRPVSAVACLCFYLLSCRFVFDKQSEAYRGFRRMINARRATRAEHGTGGPAVASRRMNDPTEPTGGGDDGEDDDDDDDAKYDPADVLDDSIIDEGQEQQQHTGRPRGPEGSP